MADARVAHGWNHGDGWPCNPSGAGQLETRGRVPRGSVVGKAGKTDHLSSVAFRLPPLVILGRKTGNAWIDEQKRWWGEQMEEGSGWGSGPGGCLKVRGQEACLAELALVAWVARRRASKCKPQRLDNSNKHRTLSDAVEGSNLRVLPRTRLDNAAGIWSVNESRRGVPILYISGKSESPSAVEFGPQATRQYMLLCYASNRGFLDSKMSNDKEINATRDGVVLGCGGRGALRQRIWPHTTRGH